MANPQKEHGYTGFSNELLNAIISYPFSASELKTVLLIARETYGWSRKKAQISYGAISRSSGISRRHTIVVIDKLLFDNVIFKQKNSSRKAAILGLNKNYESWALWHKSVVRRASPDSDAQFTTIVMPVSPEVVNPASPDIVMPSSPLQINKEKKKIKESNNSTKVLLKTDLMLLCNRYRNDKFLIKNHLFKEGYSEAEIENVFEKHKIKFTNGGG